MNLINRNWNGRLIRQREDGYLSATDMCQTFGKLFGGWSRLKSTKEHLKALQERRYADVHNGNLVETNQGGTPEEQGTWVHRKVAIRLAQWLCPQFAVQVDEWVEDLLTKGHVELANDSEPQPNLAVLNRTEKIIELAERYQNVFGDFSPQIAQGFKDLVGNTILSNNLLEERKELWMGVANYAEVELDINVPRTGEYRNSSLGKWIRWFYPELSDRRERRLCNETQREIYVYPIHVVGDSLKQAVYEFFNHPSPSTALKEAGAFKRNKIAA